MVSENIDRPPGEPWKINPGCLCSEATGSWSLLWLGESLWDNLAICHHQRPSQDWPQRQTACLCVRISQETGESESELGQHSLTNSTQRKVFQLAVSWLWHVLDWRLMSCPLVLPRTSSKHSLSMTWQSVFEDALWTPWRHLQQAVNAIEEWATRNGFRFAAHKCKSYISLHHGLGLRDPHSEDWRHTSASGGVHEVSWAVVGLAPLNQETHQCAEHSAGRLSTSSEWSLTWNGEETETHSWCCTVPLFVPSLTMVASCMAQHQTPTYDNWTAFITLDWDWHWEHSAPAQCPACTQRPTKLLSRNVG